MKILLMVYLTLAINLIILSLFVQYSVFRAIKSEHIDIECNSVSETNCNYHFQSYLRVTPNVYKLVNPYPS